MKKITFLHLRKLFKGNENKTKFRTKKKDAGDHEGRARNPNGHLGIFGSKQTAPEEEQHASTQFILRRPDGATTTCK